MRKTLMIFSVMMAMTGCRYTFDIEKTGLETELCIRSVICADSTASILMHKAVPITDVAELDTTLISPMLTLKCNGDEIETTVSCAENGGRRFTTDAFKAGDRLEIIAGAEGVETVMASTTVPEEFPMYEIHDFGILPSNNSTDEQRAILSYKDNPETDDFYGVSVDILLGYHYSNSSEIFWSSSTVYPGEGYDNLELDPNAYSPTIGEIEGKKVYIWKDTEADGEYEIRFKSSHGNVRIVEKRTRFCLYKFSEELYKTLKADFEAGYNPMFYIGFATPSFTYTNIDGGLGYFGAYSKTYSDWIIEKTSNE